MSDPSLTVAIFQVFGQDQASDFCAGIGVFVISNAALPLQNRYERGRSCPTISMGNAVFWCGFVVGLVGFCALY